MGTHIAWAFQTPLSRASLVAVLLIALLLGGPLADLLRWHRWGTRLALAGLLVPLVPTFVARIGYYPFDPNLRALNDCLGGVTRDWFSPEELLNLLLLTPLGVGLVLASRRFGIAAAIVVGTAITIELGQSVSGLGACERGDLVRNAAGGLIAAGLTWAVVRVWRSWGRETGADRGAPTRPTPTVRRP